MMIRIDDEDDDDDYDEEDGDEEDDYQSVDQEPIVHCAIVVLCYSSSAYLYTFSYNCMMT